VIVFYAEIVGNRGEKILGGLGGCLAGVLALLGDEFGIEPDRLAVAPPVEREGPARQCLARIPFALAVMQEAARREAVAQPADQLVGGFAFLRADGGGVPLLAFEIVDRDEGRLAAHGQPHVAGLELGVDLAERIKCSPGFLVERLCDARVLGHAVTRMSKAKSTSA
jgi:hypothetical protein